MSGSRQLVLLGAGAAHRQVLHDWAMQPLTGVQITLVTAQTHSWHAPRLAGFVAGHWPAEDCQWELEPLVQRSGVQWLRSSVRSLDMNARNAVLDDGRTLNFDWLSVNVPGVQNRDLTDADLPGAREHALFVHPLAAFASLWPQVLALSATRPLRFTVVGAGITGCELALALQHRVPDASITLLSGQQPPLAHCVPGLQARMLQVLKQRKITVLQDRAMAVNATTVRLGCGADLASDVTVLATGVQLPRWLADSGLAQDGQGHVVLDEYQRSSSHPSVLVTGALVSGGPQADQGAAALAIGSNLTRNLAASVAKQPLTPTPTPAADWLVVHCGSRNAMASGRGFVLQGAWVWWLARWRDQRWLRQKPLSAPTHKP